MEEKTNRRERRKLKSPPEINWDKVPIGTEFTAIINGNYVSGKIQKESDIHSNSICIYLCQDVCNGNKADDTLGFKYSWTILEGTSYIMRNNGVENLCLMLENNGLFDLTPYFKNISPNNLDN